MRKRPTAGRHRLVIRLTEAMVAALVMVVASDRAWANAAPTRALLHGAGGLALPVESIPVVVDRENLHIDLRPGEAREGSITAATITAEYSLRNAGSDLKLSMVFPMRGGASAQLFQFPLTVKCNGEGLPYRQTGTPGVLDSEDLAVDPAWLDPFTSAAYEPPVMDKIPPPEFIEFDVDLAAGESKSIVIEYRQPVSSDHGPRFLKACYRCDYLLRPARHWSHFGPMTVTVTTRPGDVLVGRPPLRRVSAGSYVGEFTGPPEENLSVFVFHEPLLPIPVLASLWWKPWPRLAFVALMAIATGGVAGTAQAKSTRAAGGLVDRSWTMLGVLLIVALTPSVSFGKDYDPMLTTHVVPISAMLAVHFLAARITRKRCLLRAPASLSGGGEE